MPFDVRRKVITNSTRKWHKGATMASTPCCSMASRPRPQLEHEPGADIRPQTEFDGYAPETYVGLAYQVGWVPRPDGTP